MKRIDRLIIVLFFPALLTLFIFGIFFRDVPIIIPGTSTEKIEDIGRGLQGDTENLREFLFIILNLHLPRVLNYGIRLENRNEVLLPLFDEYINVEDINFLNRGDFFDTSGAMEFQFWADDNNHISLYAPRGEDAYKSIRIGEMTKIRVEGYFKQPIMLPTNTVDNRAATADPNVIDASKSRLYLYLPDYYLVLIYVLSLIATSGLLLLYKGINEFIKDRL